MKIDSSSFEPPTGRSPERFNSNSSNISLSEREMLNIQTSHKEAPRFCLPNWMARPILGHRRFMTLPTDSIAYEVNFRGIQSLHRPGISRFICYGDLTPYLHTVAESAAAREVNELIDCDLDYRETEVYRDRIKLFETGHRQKFHARRFQSKSDIDEFFEYQGRLIRSIMAYGCLSQKQLSEAQREHVPEYSDKRPVEHEIGIAIGPNGETWMFRTGHHRLHIARNIGIRQIPVEVHFVHREWLRKLWQQFRQAPLPIARVSD